MKSMRLKHLFVISLAIAFGLFSCKTDIPNDSTLPLFSKDKTLTANVDDFVNYYVSASGPGITLLVYAKGEMLLKKGYGLANIREQIPMSSKTPVYLASISKQITAMAVMILVEDKVLNFNDKLIRFLPEAPDTWEPITLHHLLTHQSGIPDYFNLIGESELDGLTNQDVFDVVVDYGKLDFPPGDQIKYSNSGYVILAIVVERVTGIGFHTFVKERIFDALRMDSSTVYDELRPEIPDRAVGYTGRGELLDYNLLTMGAGGIFSTAEDLFKWDRSFYSNALVSSTIQAATFKSYKNWGYGYGWQINTYRGREYVFHGGAYQGFFSRISRIPEEDLLIVILSNGSFAQVIHDLNDEILNYLIE